MTIHSPADKALALATAHSAPKNTHPNRRLVLAGLAAVPLSAGPSLAAAAPLDLPVRPALTELIARHNKETEHFRLACQKTDDDHEAYDPNFRGWDRADRRERMAAIQLLNFVCKNAEEEALRARHFLDRMAPDMGDFQHDGRVEMLLQALANACPAAAGIEGSELP